MIRFLIVALFIASACSGTDKRLAEFNQQLGTEKAASLDRISSSFEDFLGWHFPDQPDFRMKFCTFIDDLAQNNYDHINEYLLPDSVASIIVKEYENSGLNYAIEFKVNKYSSPTPTIHYDFNIVGAYHQALSSIEGDDFIANYILAREENRHLTYPQNISSFLDYCMEGNYNDPILKRIATMEFYILIAYMSLT